MPDQTTDHTVRKTTYKDLRTALTRALSDLEILSGNAVGPSDSSWQDIAGTCATNLHWLANMLHSARHGNCEPFITFPSVHECLEDTSNGQS